MLFYALTLLHTVGYTFTPGGCAVKPRSGHWAAPLEPNPPGCVATFLKIINAPPTVCGDLRWSSSLFHCWSAATQGIQSPVMWIYSAERSEQQDVVWPRGVHGEFVGFWRFIWGKVAFFHCKVRTSHLNLFEFCPGGEKPAQWVVIRVLANTGLDVLELLGDLCNTQQPYYAQCWASYWKLVISYSY